MRHPNELAADACAAASTAQESTARIVQATLRTSLDASGLSACVVVTVEVKIIDIEHMVVGHDEQRMEEIVYEQTTDSTLE